MIVLADPATDEEILPLLESVWNQFGISLEWEEWEEWDVFQTIFHQKSWNASPGQR